jgi:hypothetical protein
MNEARILCIPSNFLIKILLIETSVLLWRESISYFYVDIFRKEIFLQTQYSYTCIASLIFLFFEAFQTPGNMRIYAILFFHLERLVCFILFFWLKTFALGSEQNIKINEIADNVEKLIQNNPKYFYAVKAKQAGKTFLLNFLTEVF